MSYPTYARLSLENLREANTDRLANFPGHADSPWNANDWMVALAGEVGELANMLKKIRRGISSPELPALPSKEMLGEEMADILTYLDLLAAHLEIDLAEVTIAKFNKVSEKWGLTERL